MAVTDHVKKLLEYCCSSTYLCFLLSFSPVSCGYFLDGWARIISCVVDYFSLPLFNLLHSFTLSRSLLKKGWTSKKFWPAASSCWHLCENNMSPIHITQRQGQGPGLKPRSLRLEASTVIIKPSLPGVTNKEFLLIKSIRFQAER